MRHFSAYELNILNNHNIDYKSITDLDIPVEYIVGEAEFFEQTFFVDNSTLIPRVETEYLIELGLKYIQNKSVTFADIGCGSGALGLSFGMQLKLRNILFNCTLTDISDQALELAKKNYQKHKAKLGDNKILIFKSNLLSSFGKKRDLDLIFANLPYIPSSRISKLDKSVRNYEPITALDGGEDGLNLIRGLLTTAKDYLAEKGVILLEVDDSHKNTKEFDKDWEIEIKNDFNGRVRYWVCKSKIS